MIFIASHVVILAACLLVVAFLVMAMLHRWHQVFVPAMAWLVSKAATHIAYLLMIFKVIGAPTMVVVLAINAAASLVSSIYIAVLIVEWMRTPTIHEMRRTNDALAKTISTLTEGNK